MHKDTRHGADAFICAVQQRAVSTWTMLLEHAAEPSTTCTDGNDVIWALLAFPEAPIQHVAQFLELGVSPSSVNVTTGRSSLHRAAGSGQSEVIKILFKFGADISHVDDDGRTPLQEAALEGQFWSVSTLIELGADVRSRAADGKTALHCAVHGMDIDVVRHLLAFGADVNSQDKRGWSPLMYACRSKRYSAADARRAGQQHDSLSLIGELLAGGANIEVRGRSGLTALHIACGLGRQDVAKLLLLVGARIEARTRVGRTPLHLASIAGRQGAVRMLAQRGASVRTTDARGNSALHSACGRGHVHIVRELLAHGARDAEQNSAGRSALDLAARAGHTAVIVALLPSRGECVGMERLAPALAAARRHGRRDTVRVLASYSAAAGPGVPLMGKQEARGSGWQGDTQSTGVKVTDADELVGEEQGMVDMLAGSAWPTCVRRSGLRDRRKAAVSVGAP
jgi:ankyrin repeat protein